MDGKRKGKRYIRKILFHVKLMMATQQVRELWKLALIDTAGNMKHENGATASVPTVNTVTHINYTHNHLWRKPAFLSLMQDKAIRQSNWTRSKYNELHVINIYENQNKGSKFD